MNKVKNLILTFTVTLALSFIFIGKADAGLLTFDGSLGSDLSLGSNMRWWNNTTLGEGHLYMLNMALDAFISFSSPTTVNNFDMNAKPWENYNGGNAGLIDLAAFDSGNNQVWSTTVDLTPYTAWSDWLNVSVETNNITSMAFYSPYNTHGNGFWPSIDNMLINKKGGSPVPEPATMLLFGSGLLGFIAKRKKLEIA